MYFIYSGGISFNLFCDESIFIKITKSSFLKSYIPSFMITKKKTLLNEIIKIKIGKTPGIFKKKGFFEITYNTNTSLEDIITLIEYCCNYFRQKQGIYSVHGSAASYNNIGIWFWGPISGIGKTSIALNLCTKSGFSFIGDENIIINSEGYILDGSKKVIFNKQSMFEYLDPIIHRSNITDNGIKISKNNIKMRIIIQPIVCHGGVLEAIEWDDKKTKFHLYEEFSRRIRGCSRLVNNWSIPIKSIDNNTISKNRVKSCANIAKSIHAFTIKGSMNVILEKIEEMILYLGLNKND